MSDVRGDFVALAVGRGGTLIGASIARRDFVDRGAGVMATEVSTLSDPILRRSPAASTGSSRRRSSRRSGGAADGSQGRVKPAAGCGALHRGVYLVGPLEAEHSRAMAAVLAAPGSLLSHYPAAVL